MLWSMKIWSVVTLILAISLFSVFMMFSFGGGGTSAAYSISGKVTSCGAGLSGVTVSLTGAASRSTTTDASGNYRFTRLAKGTYTVKPSMTGYSFTPEK